MGLTTPPRKKGSVTETRTDSQPLLSTLGEDGDSDSAPELMMTRGESRKNLSDRTPSSSARSLRIASWNVRTLYEAGKCVQAYKRNAAIQAGHTRIQRDPLDTIRTEKNSDQESLFYFQERRKESMKRELQLF